VRSASLHPQPSAIGLDCNPADKASGAFPDTTQAYYEAVLEPLFDAMGGQVKPALLGAPAVAADAAAALGLALFAGAAPAAVVALAVATLLRSRKA